MGFSCPSHVRFVAVAMNLVLLALFFQKITFAQPEQISEFHSSISAQRDGTLVVTELIKYDFDNLPDKHGIIRWIPLRYWRHNARYNLRFRLISVQNETGVPYKVKTSRTLDGISIRIGSPDQTVSGIHHYALVYATQRAINYFPDYDEIYWNVTGNEWSVPIHHISAVVHLPEVSAESVSTACFTGWLGSSASDCDKRVIPTKNGTDIIFSSRDLSPGEGFSVVVGVPSGTFPRPSRSRRSIWFLQDNIVLGVPILTLLVMSVVFVKYGREYPLPPVAVLYEPPDGLRPAEIGAIIDESLDPTDITSTVVDLAVRKYVRIREVQSPRLLFLSRKDYEFTLLQPFQKDRSLSIFEYWLLIGIFGTKAAPGKTVLLSSLKNSFYLYLQRIRDGIFRSLSMKRVFYGLPNTVRFVWIFTGSVIGFIVFLSYRVWGYPGAVAGILTGLIISAFGWFMPKKTPYGIRLYGRILGFLEFFKRVDLDVIRRLHREDPSLFHRFLPYALIFGLADEWMSRFQDLITEAPYWYDSPDWASGRFYPTDLGHRLGRALPAMASTFSSTPKASGGAGAGFSGFRGGFSGGGFGGGGGSSW
ncbi:MAG: DUF2207 domain-containing protein [bacterium JZ-2024 1]